ASDLTIAKFAPATMDTVFAAQGCRSTSDPKEACQGADVVIVAVKPRMMDHIIRFIKPFVDQTIVVSVVGGLTIGSLGAYFPNAIFRAIPNTASAEGESVTFLCSDRATIEQQAMVEGLFSRLGLVINIEESLMEVATALGSCGIAFAMRYMRASIEGAVQLGLHPVLAQQIVAQTLRGAATIITNNPDTHTEVEVDRVTTAGGITIAGLNAMEDRGFTPSVVAGLRACGSRG
ncbi:MAG: pyrroline-5-carboxylate reductase dimerization domain-containing protein, partial [Mucinivorans sp.]